MKKITLLALLVGFFSYSQDPLWSTDCDDYATADYLVIDADGDTFGFQAMNAAESELDPVTIAFFSESFHNDTLTALTPDNWIFSPEMTIPANTESVTISVDVYAADSSWAGEKFSIGLYESVGTEDAQSLPFHTEILTSAASVDSPKTVSITIENVDAVTNFSNLTVRMFVRHWDCTDMFRLVIDNMSVTVNSSLSVEGFNTSDVELYPNPTNGLINIAGTDIRNIKEISIFNQLGQKVMNLNASQLNNNSFDISDLNKGIYFVQLKDNSNNSKTMKIVKE
ncbi:hypothetical protein FORMB_16070 [Formosa sp. Hel1_33_131]|uniref:T9SS type A sorting domain-containing protein n=1 Tax=Formosa sp. Hel1_33_131 TaxID=1336794 RepID=UPI00084E1BA0|nr:T9SS type A sorting domain-containing protein [Formosa sp. Hel1_33_131]AOR28647.1 hypothetical protein FORMB_16070 [Formosa sp. Hel1_33_131]